MKAYCCKWVTGHCIVFAKNIKEAIYKFDSLGQPYQIEEIDLSNIIIDCIKIKSDNISANLIKFDDVKLRKKKWNASKTEIILSKCYLQ